jgi:hypothetical protein
LPDEFRERAARALPSPAVADTEMVKTLHDIPGWFGWIDQAVLTHFLSAGAVVPRGDVVELGATTRRSRSTWAPSSVSGRRVRAARM